MTNGGRTGHRAESPPVGDPSAFSRDQCKHALHHVIWFLQRQKTFIVVTLLSVTILSAAMSYLIAPIYTAKAAIVVERSRNPVLRDETERPITAIEVANDLRDIIRSRPVIEAVVDQLRPHERPRRQSSAIMSVLNTLDRLGLFSLPPLRERYIRRWSKSLLVEADGDYVALYLADEDPEIAAGVLNAIVDAQQRRYVDVLRASHGSHLRREMYDRAQAEMASLRETLLSFNAPSANSTGYVTALARLSSIRQLISTADAQVSTLRSRLGPGHPDTLAAQQMSLTLRDALSAVARDVQSLERTASLSEEMQILIQSYGEVLDSARKSVDQSQMREQSDTRTVSVRVAERALPPIAPDASRIFQVLIGFAAGLFFAIGAAFIRDRLSSPLVSISGVEAILRSPVRGILGDSRRLARRLRKPHYM